jgi:hypothetical protein
MASLLAKNTSQTGQLLVTKITKYLSTLPHPIEIVEELVAVCAVTSSLLNTLSSALHFFRPLTLSPNHSFVGPLCHDFCFAFKQLEEKVDEARRMKVFEPNDVGLVRLPRAYEGALRCALGGNPKQETFSNHSSPRVTLSTDA